jgi:hypothetical protein
MPVMSTTEEARAVEARDAALQSAALVDALPNPIVRGRTRAVRSYVVARRSRVLATAACTAKLRLPWILRQEENAKAPSSGQCAGSVLPGRSSHRPHQACD